LHKLFKNALTEKPHLQFSSDIKAQINPARTLKTNYFKTYFVSSLPVFSRCLRINKTSLGLTVYEKCWDVLMQVSDVRDCFQPSEKCPDCILERQGTSANGKRGKISHL